MRLLLLGLLLLLIMPLAAAHGDAEEEKRTTYRVPAGAATVTFEHVQQGDGAACRLSVETQTRPLPQSTQVGRSCPPMPEAPHDH